ncbi:CaiB/BaiF CoA transferase family protein [Antarcticimicrobium sediminis]|uniref:CoA transferase n=1 Tax=Antarcticimicrobium sediminis TaxID=2546227 RepID=A0A4R5EZ81_9RHOB|nr:CaiB/BaiF CoA-transferase family protein [Antarcticimicrobium sediminis]TDE40435.1 CoA transferase [Antarcticimicrobium sediminis]
MLGALSSLRVVEFSGIGPCPLAGQMLADLGAQVCVVDRASGPAEPSDINRRGKQSIAVDLKTPEGVEIARRLIARADVLIEGYRPGVMESLGVAPEAATAINPMLVYGRVTGWGQDGPYAPSAGHDLTYLAITGALHAMGGKDTPPTPPLNLVADYGGGTMALLFGVLAALIERMDSGRGQVVDAAMVDGVTVLMGLLHGKLATGDMSPERESNMLDGAAPFYRCYETQDGKYVAVGAIEPKFYGELLRLTGLPQSRLATQRNRAFWPQQTAEFADIFRQKTQQAWQEIFTGTDACVAPVHDWEAARRDPHTTARAALVQVGTVWQAAPAPRLDRTPGHAPRPPEAPGKGTEDILEDIGFSTEETARLRQSRALM